MRYAGAIHHTKAPHPLKTPYNTPKLCTTTSRTPTNRDDLFVGLEMLMPHLQAYQRYKESKASSTPQPVFKLPRRTYLKFDDDIGAKTSSTPQREPKIEARSKDGTLGEFRRKIKKALF
jgi:hypothetical protein